MTDNVRIVFVGYTIDDATSLSVSVDTSKVWHVEHTDELRRWKQIRCIVKQEQKQKGHNYAIWRPFLLTLFTAISPAAVHHGVTQVVVNQRTRLGVA